MEVLDILGYLGALLIGVVLGLIGGGGSILTVPVLVYLLAIDAVTATAYSLFVVGVSSLVGAVQNIQKKRVDLRTAIVFSVPAFIAVYGTRRFLVPVIPETVLSFGGIIISKDAAIMIFFAVIMIMASVSMLRKGKDRPLSQEKTNYNYPLILLEGLIIGVLTGIVGAGGGFLIIPVLVLLAKLPMKKAVATSLLIVAIKSIIGFLGDLQNLEIDWSFLLVFTAISIAGIFLGIYLNRFFKGKKLKKGFGWFVLLMGIYIIWKEVIALG